MSSTDGSPGQDEIDTQAAAWFARTRSGEMTAGEIAAHQRWLARSVHHRTAFARMAACWDRMEAARAHPRVLAMRESARKRLSWSSRRPARLVLGAAACVLCLIGAALVAQRIGWLQPDTWLQSDSPTGILHRTRIGQKATLSLPDGSTVVLDADSIIETQFTHAHRRVVLLRGRAYFRVVHDPDRPFIVAAAHTLVTDIGTSFDVEIRTAAVAVTLFKGRVRVMGSASGSAVTHGASAAPAVEMTAGYRLIASNNEDWSLRREDTRNALGWLHGRLVFDGEALADVVAEVNRYSSTQIRIVDPAIAARRLSAVLTAGDISTFLSAVQGLHLAQVRHCGAAICLVAPQNP